METLQQRQRQEAIKRYEALPWPTKNDEEWRRTDPTLVPHLGSEFESRQPVLRVGFDAIPPELIHAGVIVTDLATAIRQFPHLMERYLFQTGTPEGLLKFVAQHEAFWNQGLFCFIPEGVAVEVPIRLRQEVERTGGAVLPHTLLVVEPGAQVTVIDERKSNGTGNPRGSDLRSDPLLVNEMVEIVVKAGATVRYIHLQRWGPSVTELFTQRTVLERDAQFFNVVVGLGGHLTKANVETVLKETGCRSELLGVLFGTADQHFDFHTLQDHQAEHTTSDLLYKSALKDRSKAIYTGLIRIRKQAQKSDAYQANRNLLLSKGAKADSIPMLEIEADDVRCTHGVAVGPVDEEQAFYLMSRGLSPQEAQCLIVEGFFEQVFKRIPLDDLKEQLMTEVTSRARNHE